MDRRGMRLGQHRAKEFDRRARPGEIANHEKTGLAAPCGKSMKSTICSTVLIGKTGRQLPGGQPCGALNPFAATMVTL
jgi:hypothetical protein